VNRNLLISLVLILMAFIFGANYAVMRWSMTTFDPAQFLLIRFALSAPILLIILKITEGTIGIARRDLALTALIGILSVICSEYTNILSIKYTTLANSSLLTVATWPILVSLLAPLFTKERLTLRIVVCGGISIIGVYLIIVGNGVGISFSHEHLRGDLFALCSSFFGALSSVLFMRLMSKYSALRALTWIIIFGTISLLPLTLGAWDDVNWGRLGSAAWGTIGYNVVIVTILASSIWNMCMRKIGVTKANYFRYFIPVASVIAGFIFFNEQITISQMAGGLIIMACLTWISFAKTD
jgi:drug/metabolite transporter (DMT)-like permease